jgi:NADPH:quinone reductase-like Zn-dependent oxidoreductase
VTVPNVLARKVRTLPRQRQARIPTGLNRWSGQVETRDVSRPLRIDRQLRAMMLSLLVRQKLGMLGAKENAADLSVLRELLESGGFTPAIDRTFPLSKTGTAIRYLEEGNAKGKILITV